MSRAEAAGKKAVATMTDGPQSMRSIESGWKKTQAAVDPIFAAQAKRQVEVEKAFKAANAAVAAGFATHQQAAIAVGAVAAKHDALISSAQKSAFAQTNLGKAMSGVSGQLVALSAGAGPVGTLLSAMGPIGLTASIGIAGVGAAFMAASNAAHTFSANMLKVRDAAQSLDLTTVQIQSITDAAAKFALSDDKVVMALSRFTAGLDEVRRGSGEFYDLIRRIDPALAREMSLTRDTASAIDVLARVYDKAGNARQKLDRAVGGRGGGGVGLLFQEIGKGGLDKLTAEFENSGDAIDKNLIEKVAKLKAEIDDTANDAKTNFASIFSSQVLETELKFVEGLRDISRVAKAFEASSDLRMLFKLAVSAVPGFGGILTSLGTMATAGAKKPTDIPTNRFEGTFSQFPSVPLPLSRPSQAIDRSTQEFDINTEKARIGILGSAANAVERLTLRQKELDLALRDNKISQEDYNRALGSANLDTSIQLNARRIGLLGDDASVAEIVAQKQREINKALQEGVNLSKLEIAAIMEKTRLRAEYAKLPNKLGFERDQIFRSDIDANVAGRLRSEGLPIDLQSAEAAQMRFNEQLRQGKDLATDFATGFARDLRNGVDATQALGNALGKLADTLMDMAIKNLVGKAFGSLFGGMTGNPGGAAGGLLGLFGGGSVNANGNIFQAGNVTPFAMGGVVNSPTMAPMALFGEAGPEAIMPLKRGSDGKLGVAAGGGDKQRPIVFAPNVDARGADAAAVARLTVAMERMQRDFAKNVLTVTGKHRENNP